MAFAAMEYVGVQFLCSSVLYIMFTYPHSQTGTVVSIIGNSRKMVEPEFLAGLKESNQVPWMSK